MPVTIKEPLIVNCFKCQKHFKIKWVISRQNYSQKNDWGYWTEKNEEKGKKICNECLKNLHEEEWNNYYDIFSPRKKSLFRVYKATGKFS